MQPTKKHRTEDTPNPAVGLPIKSTEQHFLDVFFDFHFGQGIEHGSVVKAYLALKSNQELLDKWSSAYARSNRCTWLASIIPVREMHKLFLNKERRDKIAEAWNCSVPSPLVRRISLSNNQWVILHYSFKDLFYRERHYDALWEEVKKLLPRGRLLLIGNPGIGKSWALNAMLMRHLAEANHDPVVVREVTGWHYFDCDGFRFFRTADALKSTLKQLFPDEKQRVLLLHDYMSQINLPWNECDAASYCGFATVLAAPPDSRSYHDFEKYRSTRFYMPPWSRKELEVIVPAGLINNDSYDVLGGVLRWYFFGPAQQYVIQAMTAAAEHLFLTGGEASAKSEEPSKVVTVCPEQPTPGTYNYSACEKPLPFVSDFVARTWTTARMKADLRNVQDRLVAMTESKWMVTRAGAVCPFRTFALVRIEAAGHCSYCVEELLPAAAMHKKKKKKKTVRLLELPRDVRVELVADASHIAANLQEPDKPTLYKPRGLVFDCFDGFLVCGSQLYLLQVTLADTHEVPSRVETVFAQLNGLFRPSDITLVWIVDRNSKLSEMQSAAVLPSSPCGKWFDEIKQVRLEMPIYFDRVLLHLDGRPRVIVVELPGLGLMSAVCAQYHMAQKIRELEETFLVPQKMNRAPQEGICVFDSSRQYWRIE